MRITGKQVAYLKSLLIEAFSHRYATIYDYNHLENLSSQEASEEISRLKSAKMRGWPKGEKPAPLTRGTWDHLDDATRERYKRYRQEEPNEHVKVFYRQE